MLYKEYRNEIPLNTIQTWSSALLADAKWEHVGWTGNPREPYRHWASYPPKEGLLAQIWTFLDESLREDGIFVKPERIILNLYNHGDSSWLHKDSDNPEDYTVILFANNHWDVNWGGDFALVGDDREIIQSLAPTPGKFIAFRSNLLHAARPVSREAPYPRFGVAFQCKHDSNLQRLSQAKISPVYTPI